MTRFFFKEDFPSTFEAMNVTLTHALQALREHSFINGADETCARLCLEEALVNAIRHGNDCNADRKVSLSMADEGENCRIRVKDEGSGFLPEEISLPKCDQLGGRGICLIRHYMDQVWFNTREHCLEMIFRRKPTCKKSKIKT